MKYLLQALFILSSFLANSQKPKQLDLGQSASVNVEQIRPGEYYIKFINYPPLAEYDTFSITVEDQPIDLLPAIDLSLLPKNGVIPKVYESFVSEPGCPADSLIDAIMKIYNENELIRFENKLDLFRNRCSSENLDLLKLKFKALTTRSSDTIEVSKGQTIVVFVKRNDDKNRYSKRWTFQTTKAGEWITSYGLNYIPRILTQEQHYFSFRITGDTSYIISEETSREKSSATLAVLFSWLPNSANSVLPVVTGGLGISEQGFSFYAGPSLAYRKNLLLNFGLTGHYQWELAGKYHAGQVVLEDLDFDQLHEKAFVLNLYFGISFRFADSPFNTGE